MGERYRPDELVYSLRFEAGWDELLRSHRSVEYQDWFASKVVGAQYALLSGPNVPSWALEYHMVAYRWQQAIEFVANHGMSWDAHPATSQGPRLEKAIQKLQKHLLDAESWETPGVSFYLPKRHALDARSDKVVDIRTMQQPRIRGPRVGVRYSVNPIDAVKVDANPKYL